jgi:LacI family transcriptional regulator
LEVPGELSIVSFDNTPIVRFAQPPLTAIDQPIAAITARAVALLIAANKTDAAAGPAPPEVLSAGLIERQSTARAPRSSA